MKNLNKTILLIVGLFFLSNVIAQNEIIQIAAPKTETVILNFSKGQQGTYKDDSKQNQIIVTSNRIIMRSYFVHGISKESIRENSKYSVRGNYLHGFYKNKDSAKVILEDDTYFFLQKEMIDLVGGTAIGKFLQISGSEFMFYKKIGTNNYEIQYIRQKGGKIIIQTLEPSLNMELALATNKQKVTGKIHTISPSITELKNFLKKEMFVDYITFKR